MTWTLFVLFINGSDIHGLPVREYTGPRAQARCQASARESAKTLSFNSSGLACVPKLGEIKTTKR